MWYSMLDEVIQSLGPSRPAPAPVRTRQRRHVRAHHVFIKHILNLVVAWYVICHVIDHHSLLPLLFLLFFFSSFLLFFFSSFLLFSLSSLPFPEYFKLLSTFSLYNAIHDIALIFLISLESLRSSPFSSLKVIEQIEPYGAVAVLYLRYVHIHLPCLVVFFILFIF